MWKKVTRLYQSLIYRDQTKWYSASKLDIIVLVLSAISFAIVPADRTSAVVTWGLIIGSNILTAFLVNKSSRKS